MIRNKLFHISLLDTSQHPFNVSLCIVRQ